MARTTLRDKWNISTGSGPTRLLVEDIRSRRGVCLWLTVNRNSGAVNPHDGSMFNAPYDEGSRQWENVPAYVKSYVAEHALAMLAEAYPGTDDAKPSYNTINGRAMTGSHGVIA